jgi:hypothetical protein
MQNVQGLGRIVRTINWKNVAIVTFFHLLAIPVIFTFSWQNLAVLLIGNWGAAVDRAAGSGTALAGGGLRGGLRGVHARRLRAGAGRAAVPVRLTRSEIAARSRSQQADNRLISLR